MGDGVMTEPGGCTRGGMPALAISHGQRASGQGRDSSANPAAGISRADCGPCSGFNSVPLKPTSPPNLRICLIWKWCPLFWGHSRGPHLHAGTLPSTSTQGHYPPPPRGVPAFVPRGECCPSRTGPALQLCLPGGLSLSREPGATTAGILLVASSCSELWAGGLAVPRAGAPLCVCAGVFGGRGLGRA